MTSQKQWFPGVGNIPHDPKAKRGSLVFRHFNPTEVVAGTSKTLGELLPFGVVAWHGVCNPSADMFGRGTRPMPWDEAPDPITKGKQRCEALFELMVKLGVDYYSWHNYDLAPEGATLKESHKNLDTITDFLAELQAATGKKLAWGTCDHFSHPRYRLGVATGVCPKVYAYGLSEVFKMLEITMRLQGKNFVLWGGREGMRQIMSIIKRLAFVLENYGRFGNSVCDYADEIGFDGKIIYEPKKREPSKVQYQSDVAATLFLLQQAGLLQRENVGLNLEENHAGLAGLDFAYEVAMARAADKLISIDANEGDPLIGWDVDEFSHTVKKLIPVMLMLLEDGGLPNGNLAFDAKLRRESTDPKDIFWGIIGAMDTWSIATKVAAQIRSEGVLDDIVEESIYAEWGTSLGDRIRSGMTKDAITNAAHRYGPTIELPSGSEERINVLINEHMFPAG